MKSTILAVLLFASCGGGIRVCETPPVANEPGPAPTQQECDDICGIVPGADSEITCENWCRCTCPGPNGETETIYGPYPLNSEVSKAASNRFLALCGGP